MFNHFINRISGLTSLFVFALFWTSAVHSAPGNITNSPLFAQSNVAPNIFFEMDDSGSMDWEILAKTHWSNCAYDRDAYRDTGNGDCGSLRSNGLFLLRPDTDARENFEYLYDNGDDAYTNFCDDNNSDNGRRETFYLCNASVQNSDWRIRSSAVNVLYYDPGETYNPWLGGTSALSNASFTAARSDPQNGTSGFNETINLGTFEGGFVYEVWDTADTHSFDQDDGRPRRGSNLNRKAKGDSDYVPGFVDLWDEHTRHTVTSNSILVQRITYSPDGNGSLNEAATTIATLTGSDTLDGRTIAEVQQNIANWYQYHRRRSFVAKAALGSVVTRNPDFHYGLSVINNSGTLFTEVPAVNITDFTTHNNGLLSDLYSYNWPARGTPLRLGLENVGEYFSGNHAGRANPIQYECQQNFSVLFTDGFWNGNPPNTVTQDVDGDGINDGNGDNVTLADVARFYYTNDLDTNLADEVPTNTFDAATYQHMVTLGIAFGVRGALQDTDNNGWPEDATDPSVNRPVSSSWGNPFNGSPQKIDDLWHAAFNSRGTFISASTPNEVSSSLNRAIGNVGNRLGSGAAVAFNTSSLSSDTNLFLAQFNKQGNKWSGNLVSYDLDPTTGNIVTEDDPTDTSGNVPPRQIPRANWNSVDELDGELDPVNSRAIITYDNSLIVGSNTGNGIPFQWANLNATRKNDFRTEPNGTLTTDDVKAEARLNYLRGDRSNEVSANGTYSFRNRDHLLGDIIHSAPTFVKLPNNSWPAASPFPSSSGSQYADFKAAQVSRNGVIYVGANDGMLHGFSETTGKEVMAYIPSYLFSSASSTEGLHYLTDPDYQHRYYVDLGSTVSDVYIDKGDGSANWHTVLIGGSRAGGRGIFALDITDPSQFSEANAANIALWEFSNADDADLGLTFSEPIIAMMNNGRWAAIFGNGYNNKGDGKAKLFILFLDGGVDGVWTDGTSGSDLDYIEIDTGVGSIVASDCLNGSSDCNGLSTPHAVDLDGDLKIDRVYAGDIKGNLWAFDISNNTETNWSVAYDDGGTPKIPKPLFVASSNQPIMDKPIVVRHPTVKDSSSPSNAPNLLVYFGTGQYLTDNDVNTTPPIQSFYGVWDHGTREIAPSDLFEQRFDTTTVFEDVNGNDVTSTIRVFNNDVNNDGNIDPNDPNETIDYSIHQGWKINFNVAGIPGERVIVDPVVHAGLVFFNTWVPDASPCHSGGSGYLMSVEQVNGGAPDTTDPAFDLNDDGTIDSNDLIKDSSDHSKKSAPVGEKFSYGLAASSKIISNNKTSKQFTPGSDGGIDNRVVRSRGGGGPGGPVGRISWQELR